MMKIVAISFLVFYFLLTGKVSPLTPTALCPPLLSPPPLIPPPLCLSPLCTTTLVPPAMVAQPPPPPYVPNVVIQPDYGSGDSSYGSTIAIVAGIVLLGAIICFLAIYLCRTARTKAPPPPPPREPDFEERPQEQESSRVGQLHLPVGTVAVPTPPERSGQIVSTLDFGRFWIRRAILELESRD